MSDADADAVLARSQPAASSADYDAVERLDPPDHRRDPRQSGRLRPHQPGHRRRLGNQYQHYAPLRGFAEGTEDEGLIGRGRGYDTRGAKTKPAFGRA
jgi:hypothetical protein